MQKILESAAKWYLSETNFTLSQMREDLLKILRQIQNIASSAPKKSGASKRCAAPTSVPATCPNAVRSSVTLNPWAAFPNLAKIEDIFSPYTPPAFIF